MKGQRRTGRNIALAVLGLLILVVLTFPLWYRIAIRPLAKAGGVTYETLEEKEGQLVFQNFRADQPGFVLTANRLVTPGSGDLWTLYRGGTLPPRSTNSSALIVTGWKLELKAPGNPQQLASPKKGATNDASAKAIFETFQAQVRELHRVAPSAELANGKVVYKGKDYSVGNLRWRDGILETDLHWAELVSPADLKAELPVEGPYRVSFRILPLELSARITLSNEAGKWHVAATNIYKGNSVRAQAVFGDSGVVPISGTLAAKNLKLAGKLFKLEQYEQVTGSLNVTLNESSYVVEVNAGLSKEPIRGGDSFGEPAEPIDPEVKIVLSAIGEKTLKAMLPARITNGTIQLKDGALKITDGTFEPQFGLGWMPSFNLTASGKALDRSITIQAQGPLNRAEVRIASDPSMSPAELDKLFHRASAKDRKTPAHH